MKISFWKDFLLLFFLVIFEEFLNVLLWETGSGSRNSRFMGCFIGSLTMVFITTLILYRRYRPLNISILYGILFGILAYTVVHTIQYPTLTNAYIILYKFFLIIIIILIFQAIMRHQLKKRSETSQFKNPDVIDH